MEPGGRVELFQNGTYAICAWLRARATGTCTNIVQLLDVLAFLWGGELKNNNARWGRRSSERHLK